MKTFLLSFVLAVLCGLALSSPAQAQVQYESIADGRWEDAATWRVTPSGSSPHPVAGSNNVVTINHTIRLDMDYDVGGNDGMLTINPTGSLAHGGQHELKIGDQSGRAQQRILILPRTSTTGFALNLYKLEFYKAQGTISADVQTASCTTFGNNTDLQITSSLVINGNLVITQGNVGLVIVNNRVAAVGTLLVKGRIDGPPNSLNDLNFLNKQALNNPFSCNVLVPLPVELVSFAARFENEQVNLRWVTASEKNADYFTVERSADSKSFVAVATVRAAGTTSARQEYVAADRGMRAGLNYYRLKQTDLDGSFTYTSVLTVLAEGGAQQLLAYGGAGQLTIALQTPGTVQQLRVLNSQGQVLHTEKLPIGTTGAITRRLQVPGMKSRQLYIVQAVTSGGVLSEKFLLAD